MISEAINELEKLKLPHLANNFIPSLAIKLRSPN